MPRLLSSLIAALVLAIGLSGCSPVGLLNATIPTGGLTIVRDIPYEPGPRHTLDVYRPDDKAGPLPTVVFIYGGAWQSGSKRDYLFVAAALARQGFMVMVPDYRLYPQVQFPGFIDDAAAAVAYAKAAASSWGGDPRRLFVVGHSAGAYIAAMLALDPAYLAKFGMTPKDLAGVAALAGPFDFLPIQQPDIQAVFSAAKTPEQTQPIDFVTGRNPPMLLLAGTADKTVLPRNTINLAAAIRAKGGEVQDRLYPGVGHIGIILAFAPEFRDRAPSLADVTRFIDDTPPVGQEAE